MTLTLEANLVKVLRKIKVANFSLLVVLVIMFTVMIAYQPDYE